MANPGILIALCAVFLAVDGSAQTVPAAGTPAPQPCKFTLERETAPAASDDETWLLTCHRQAPAVARPAEPVVQRRIIKADPAAGATAL